MSLKLYDTTLRDGTQREGLSLSIDDKLKIARKLDELGVHYIEGGFPGSNPKDQEFFRRVRDEGLTATIVAFSSTRRKHVRPEDDPHLNALVDSGTPAVCVFGKSWDLHVSEALLTTLEENLKMIGDSVAYLKGKGLEVIYDAEHFFDGYRHNPDYALQTLAAAEQAGADWLVLCDTNGGTLPLEVQRIVREVKAKTKRPLGIHAHNDSECAVANSLIAVEEGAAMVQGTVNGYGERCGNANLVSIIPNLVLKLGVECLPDNHLGHLTEAAHFVSEIANVTFDPHQPYVGQSAFAHKGGVHISAILRSQGAYEHVDPALVGNAQRILVSELAGASTIIAKARLIGVDLSKQQDRVADILTKLKTREKDGYLFEAADGSLAMFIMKNTGSYRPLFTLESFAVNLDRWRTGRLETEAIVKLKLGDERVVEVAEGNGPVNALDRALRRALNSHYPGLEAIKLTDFKVRVFDQKKGTGAKVRVYVESTDGEHTWGTIGVSENLVEASWQALVDSLEYGLLAQKARAK